MSQKPASMYESLARELAIRGLSQEEFAAKAGVDSKTVSRAVRGRRLHTKTFGKILVALGAIPILDAAHSLEQSA